MRIVFDHLSACFYSLFFIFAGLNPVTAQAKTAVAIFAGGCFWCMQSDFDKVHGVVRTVAGYTGGDEKNPTYEQVSSGQTGHYESVQVFYDPALVTYSDLLNIFWHNVDPTDPDGQFCDKGKQYRSVIFYQNSEQEKMALASRAKLIESKRFNHIVTEIKAAKYFYPAEEYHQEYYKKNPLRYKFYRYNCGRDKRLMSLWGNARGK